MKYKQRIDIEKKFIGFELNKKAFEWVDKNIFPIKDFYLQIGIMLYWFNFLNLCKMDETRNMTVSDAERIYNRFFGKGERNGIYELLKPKKVCFRSAAINNIITLYPSIAVFFDKTHIKNSSERGKGGAIKVIFYYNRGKKSKDYYPIQIITI